MWTSVSPWKWGADQPTVSNTAEGVAAAIAQRARSAAAAEADDAKEAKAAARAARMAGPSIITFPHALSVLRTTVVSRTADSKLEFGEFDQ